MRNRFEKTGRHPGAFTLIELMIIVTITVLISAALAVGTQRAQLKARFDDHTTNIQRIISAARGYSLANYLVEDTEPVNYYLLSLAPTKISLKAVSESGLEEDLDAFSFNTDFTANSTLDVYYFPPYGEVCFSADCSDSLTENSTIFSDLSGTYSVTVTVNVHGGYAEIE